MLAVILAHISEAPVLASAELPLLAAEVRVRQSDRPDPHQGEHDARTHRIVLSCRVGVIEVRDEHRDDGPVRVDKLRSPIR